jgi:hypothetical protein
MHRIVSFVASINTRKIPWVLFLFWKKITPPPTKISEAFFFPSKSFHKSKRPRAELEIGMCHNDALPEYPSTSIKTLLQVERVGLVSQSASRRQGPSLVQQLPTDCNNCEEKRVLSSRVCVPMSILNAWSTLCMIDSSRAKVAIVASRMRKLASSPGNGCYAGISLRQRQYRVLELVARA